MRGALILMILIGGTIGCLMPISRRAAPAAEAASSQPHETPRETKLTRWSNGHFYTDAYVNKKTIRFVVDTGATDVALTEADAHMAGIQFDPSKFHVVGTGASGDVTGQEVSLDEVDLDGKRVRDLKGVVLHGLQVSLLGQNYLRQLRGVQIDGDTMTLR